MSDTEKAFVKLVLHDAMKNLEKEKGNYYSFLKDYIFDFENNNKSTNSRLKNVISFVQSYSKKVGENKAIKDLMHGLSTINNTNIERTYYALKNACKNNSTVTIKKQIIKNSNF